MTDHPAGVSQPLKEPAGAAHNGTYRAVLAAQIAGYVRLGICRQGPLINVYMIFLSADGEIVLGVDDIEKARAVSLIVRGSLSDRGRSDCVGPALGDETLTVGGFTQKNAEATILELPGANPG